MADNGEQKASTSAGDAGGADPQEVIRALMDEREELRSELEDMQMLATLNEALQEKHKMEMEALQESLAEMSSLQTLNVVLESQQEAELREVSERNGELEKVVASLQTRVVELEVALEDAKSSGGGGASAATEAAEATPENQQKESNGSPKADEKESDEKQSDEKDQGDVSSSSAVETPSTEEVAATAASESAEKDRDGADEYVPSKEEEEAMLAVGFSKDQLRDLSRKHSRHAVKSVIFKKQAQLGFMGKERPIEVPDSGDKEPETKEELQAAYSKSKEEVEKLRARNSQLELKVDFLGQQVLELQAAQALNASAADAAPPSSGASTQAAAREVPVDAAVSSSPEQKEEADAVKEAAAPAVDGAEEVVKKTQPQVDYVPSEEETAVLKQLGLSEGQMRSMARKHARHQVRTMIFRKQAALGFLAPEKALKDDAVALGANAQPKPTLANATAVSQSTPVLAVSTPVTVAAPAELQPQAGSGDEGMNAEAVKALSGMGYTDSQLRNLSRKHSRHQVKTMIFKKQAMLGFLGGSSVAQQAAGLLEKAEKEVQPANVGRSSLATCSTTAKDLESTEGSAAPQQPAAEASNPVADKDAPSGDGEGERAAPSGGADSAASDADASVTVKEEEGDKGVEEVAKPEENATKEAGADAGADAGAEAGGEAGAGAGAGGEEGGDASGGGETAEDGKKDSDEQAKKKKKRKSHHPSSSSGLKTKDEERKERKERRKSRRKTMKAGPLKGESLKSVAAGEGADSSKPEETPEEKEAREAKEAEKRERRERRKSKRKTLKPGSSLKSGDDGDKKSKRKSMSSSKRKSKKMSSSKLGGDDGNEEPKKGGITFA